MIGYTCKYTPLELMAAFGLDAERMDAEQEDFQEAETLTHVNLCSHAKMVIQRSADQAEADTNTNVTDVTARWRYQGVVLTDCCDSLRRAYEVLPQQEREHYLLDLPHSDSVCALERFSKQLVAFSKYCERVSGTTFDFALFAQCCERAQYTIPDSPFIAVLGARTSEALLATFQTSLALPVIDLSCGGNRSIGKLPEEAKGWDFEQLMSWYARELMSMVPCMRMTEVSGRRALFEHPNLRGIIYNTVKFCDFYGFDYDQVIRQTSLPVLKLESDFTPTPAGQLATRLQAFGESLGGKLMGSLLKRTRATESTTSQAAKIPEGEGAQEVQIAADAGSTSAASKQMLFGGIDSGSTSTNMVIIDDKGTILAHTSVRTGPKAAIGAAAALEEVCQQLNINAEDIDAIVATGYGRDNIEFASASVTEITCHAHGAHYLYPQARTIVDIGGQDSKIICLEENGSVANFVMNDKCAAGTGRFMEAMARTLELSLDEMSQRGLSWNKDLTISSMCTVFAESEVISLIADNHTDADIIHGLDKAVASKVGSMATRIGAKGPYMMTGGVARNAGVVKALEAKLGEPLFVAENPDLCGALGAALFALD